MTLVRKLAILYAAMFFLVVCTGYVASLDDASGHLSGLFSLQRYDGLLYGFSGAWALAAALLSHHQSVLYFRLFGAVYLLDGMLGIITGSGCLDGGIFVGGFRSFNDIELPARFFANAPHLAIGGFAVFVGFRLSKRVGTSLAAA